MTTHVGAQTLKRSETHPIIATSQAKAAAGSRMFFVDNLRVFLTILVVLHHLSITYGADGSWFYLERPTTELAGILLTTFVILNQFYFMGLFFLISGYFVPGAVERKGSLRFLKDRLVRLGIPLVIYSLLLSPYVEYVKATRLGYFSGSLGQFYLDYWQDLRFAPGPLWFVEALLAFTLVYLLGRAALGWVKSRQPQPTRTATQKPLTHGKIVAFILALAALTFGVRLIFPTSVEWNHFELAFFPQYILMFATGILVYRNGWLPDLPNGVRKAWSLIVPVLIVTLPLIMIFGGAVDNPAPFKGGLTWQSAFCSTFEAVYCVAMSILMLGLFRQRLDRQGDLGRFLSRNAYSVYIIHPMVIVPLGLLLGGISIDPLLKFILVAPLAVSLCFAAAQFLMRRIPYSERVL
ncbi:MAG: acyltransferase [Anaerolineales bacterium]|nr:acyltransferase [Anaerolineales bacterium]